jgi:hypothetical protein
MSGNRSKSILTSKPGFIDGLVMRIKLILRLMGDKRVNPILKLIPIGSLVYLVLPDIPGPFDDAAVLWLGSYLFVELCPPQVVEEHMATLKRTISTEWHDTPPKQDQADAKDEDVIDGEFRDE